MRAVDVVVPTPEVIVVRRDDRVVVRLVDVLVDVDDADAAVVDAEADGCSGAFVFCTCVAANAVIPESEVSVIAVAIPRRIALERMIGFVFERVCMSIGDHATARRA